MIGLIVALTAFTQDVRAKIAVLIVQKTVETVHDHGKHSIMQEISENALEQQVLSVFSRIFDKATTCGHDNCSINALREKCCESDASEDLIKKIDSLIEEYEATISKDVRNKKLAHFDYKSVMYGKPCYISFASLAQLADDLSDTISAVSREFMPGEICFPPMSELVDVLKKEHYK